MPIEVAKESPWKGQCLNQVGWARSGLDFHGQITSKTGAHITPVRDIAMEETGSQVAHLPHDNRPLVEGLAGPPTPAASDEAHLAVFTQQPDRSTPEEVDSRNIVGSHRRFRVDYLTDFSPQRGGQSLVGIQEQNPFSRGHCGELIASNIEVASSCGQ
jgi:hypothetical protein